MSDNNPIENLSPAMMEEAMDVHKLMEEHVMQFIAPLMAQICTDCMISSITNPLALDYIVESNLIMGVFLYRRLLIESGVDVIALEQNFKDLNLD